MNSSRFGNWIVIICRAAAAAALLAMPAAPAAQAQTFSVIYNFPAQHGVPWSGLTMDRSGNMYGTAFNGGTGQGAVYKMTRSPSGWIVTPLYNFAGGNDGAHPYAGLTIGPDGTLYGTTFNGGNSACTLGCGTVYRLVPPPTACKTALCSWNETVLYRFSGAADGRGPYAGVIVDQAGNVYGTTIMGGSTTCNGGFGCGVVYKLTPNGGAWTQSVLHRFEGGSADGVIPKAGLVMDNTGNLYGTTIQGGAFGLGTVYKLAPSGGGWTASLLYSFSGGTDGWGPIAGLIFDSLGNLYGADANNGSDVCKVFELTPGSGSWNFSLIYSFTYLEGANCAANLAFDNAGNLYGSTAGGGAYANGVVFKLTPSGGGWSYSALHEFTGGSDGEDLYSTPVFDSQGSLYGTASVGGGFGTGDVFQIAP